MQQVREIRCPFHRPDVIIRSQKVQSKKTSGSSEFSDKLEISNAAKSYQTAKSAVNAAEDVRMDKVEALRAQFANRTYNVSSEDVADKIIADAETLVF